LSARPIDSVGRPISSGAGRIVAAPSQNKRLRKRTNSRGRKKRLDYIPTGWYVRNQQGNEPCRRRPQRCPPGTRSGRCRWRRAAHPRSMRQTPPRYPVLPPPRPRAVRPPPGAPGDANGRREIKWGGVPAEVLFPQPLSAGIFKKNSARGMVLTVGGLPNPNVQGGPQNRKFSPQKPAKQEKRRGEERRSRNVPMGRGRLLQKHRRVTEGAEGS